MAIVKRTFSIPDELSNELNASVPNQERSKFVSKTLANALKELKNKELVTAIDSVDPWEQGGQSVTETIRQIRSSQMTS